MGKITKKCNDLKFCNDLPCNDLYVSTVHILTFIIRVLLSFTAGIQLRFSGDLPVPRLLSNQLVCLQQLKKRPPT